MGKRMKTIAKTTLGAFENVTIARLVVAVIVVTLLMLHGFDAKGFTVDPVSIGLLVVLLITVLVPLLDSASFPGGGGLKFRQQLDQLKDLSDAAVSDVTTKVLSAAPSPLPSEASVGTSEKALTIEAAVISGIPTSEFEPVGQDGDALVEEILRESARSPRVGLMLLSAELDRSVKELLLTTGWATPQSQRSLQAGIHRLVELKVLTEGVASALSLYSNIRNQIVHGTRSISDEDTLRAIDAGIPLLKSVLSIPHERNLVDIPNVPIFSDDKCEHSIPNVMGLMLTTISPGRATISHRIFPTTRNWYQTGQEVTWEWNLALQIGEAWYRNPNSNSIELAWSGSLEFVGRPLV
jgi:hypothetical protein